MNEFDVRQYLIDAVTACGDTLVEDADAIVGDFTCRGEDQLSIHIEITPYRAPSITVENRICSLPLTGKDRRS